jgi:hypothetical protein
MDPQKVDMYIATNAKYFDSYMIPQINDMLLKADDSKYLLMQTVNLRDPTTMLIISILAGHFGIDRFMIGDVGLGIAKLLTCGGLGIWTLVDLFIIMGKTRETNFMNFQRVFY